jgi:hypothetical protein
MDDEATLWTILVLYLLVAGLIGALLPTWPLSITGTAAFALGVLLLVLVNEPEVSWEVAQLLIAIALLVGAVAHLAMRVARVWGRKKATAAHTRGGVASSDCAWCGRVEPEPHRRYCRR